MNTNIGGYHRIAHSAWLVTCSNPGLTCTLAPGNSTTQNR